MCRRRRPPSFNVDGSLAGGSTFKLDGEYFSDPERKHLHPDDYDLRHGAAMGAWPARAHVCDIALEQGRVGKQSGV